MNGERTEAERILSNVGTGLRNHAKIWQYNFLFFGMEAAIIATLACIVVPVPIAFNIFAAIACVLSFVSFYFFILSWRTPSSSYSEQLKDYILSSFATLCLAALFLCYELNGGTQFTSQTNNFTGVSLAIVASGSVFVISTLVFFGKVSLDGPEERMRNKPREFSRPIPTERAIAELDAMI